MAHLEQMNGLVLKMEIHNYFLYAAEHNMKIYFVIFFQEDEETEE
jgi:hypothetical protein